MSFLIPFLAKIFLPEFIKKFLDFCIKKNPIVTFLFAGLLATCCYLFFHKEKDFSHFSENERRSIKKEMLRILSNCHADGSGISYAEVSFKNTVNVHDIRYIDVFGYSLLFQNSTHIQQLGNVDMFLNPDPLDDVAYAQIIQKFINEFHMSILINVNQASEIVNTVYIDTLKAKLWVEMNELRVKNGLQPYKLTQMQIYPVLDKKSNMIYILTMTFTNNNLCNTTGLQAMFDEVGLKIEHAIQN